MPSSPNVSYLEAAVQDLETQIRYDRRDIGSIRWLEVAGAGVTAWFVGNSLIETHYVSAGIEAIAGAAAVGTAMVSAACRRGSRRDREIAAASYRNVIERIGQE